MSEVWLRLRSSEGLASNSSQVFGHLGSFKGSIQTEACAKYEKVLPPLVEFVILGTTKSPEICDLMERVGL